MAKLNIDYDKKWDVCYVINGKGEGTINMSVDDDMVVRLNSEANKVVGFTITNFSHGFPKLVKHTHGNSKWFAEEFFNMVIKEFNNLMKALVRPEEQEQLQNPNKVDGNQMSLIPSL